MILVLDTETTGVAKTDQVIELAYSCIKDLDIFDRTLEVDKVIWHIEGNKEVNRYRPTTSINPRAFEVHGIGLAKLLHHPKPDTISLPEVSYIIGHNISFDARMIKQSNPTLGDKLDSAKYICTLDLSKKISKFSVTTIPKNKLDTLIEYFLPETSSRFNTKFHSAEGDIIKTTLVLHKLLHFLPAIKSYEELYTFLNNFKKVK